VIGVDFKAHIMVLKVSSDGTSIDSASVVEGIQYAAMMKEHGVNVVALNGSFGGPDYNSSEASAIQAAGDAGIIFCVAAGNSTNDNDVTPFYPAAYHLNNMIVVAASDQNDQLAVFSNYGAKSVDLAAPGVNVLSLLPLALTGNSASVRQSQSVYSAFPLEYAGTAPTNGVTGTMYYCNLGNPGDFPAGVSNNLALIQRGTLTFAAKVSNAMNAGARAAVIFNNATGSFNGTLGGTGNWIPAVSLSQADGATLEAALPATATVFNAPDPTQSYQFLDGTSMAAPHVSGAVAFAAMNFPNETAVQRVQRILAHTTPLPGLAGLVATGGRLNLAATVDTDGNGLPDWWELQYFGHLTGTDPAADPDHDGADNLAEFLAGTDPTDPHSVFHLALPVPLTGNRWQIQWPSVDGRYYRILRSTNLLSGINTVVQTNLTATPPLNTFTDAPPSPSRAVFYRLELEP
jgi:subtilisin family serine protease